METRKAIQLLNEAILKLSDPTHFTVNAEARDICMKPCDAADPRAYAFSLKGVLRNLAPLCNCEMDELKRELCHFIEQLAGLDLDELNDTQGREGVIEALVRSKACIEEELTSSKGFQTVGEILSGIRNPEPTP